MEREWGPGDGPPGCGKVAGTCVSGRVCLDVCVWTCVSGRVCLDVCVWTCVRGLPNISGAPSS